MHHRFLKQIRLSLMHHRFLKQIRLSLMLGIMLTTVIGFEAVAMIDQQGLDEKGFEEQKLEEQKTTKISSEEKMPIEPQQLAPCPNSPNCVCSDEHMESSQYIAPIVSPSGSAEEPAETSGRHLLAALAAYLDSQSEYTLVHQSEDYLRVEARTRLLRFVDDIEMQVRGDKVYVRSASRVGYSDLGKNRKRLEGIRDAMVRKGVAQPLK